MLLPCKIVDVIHIPDESEMYGDAGEYLIKVSACGVCQLAWIRARDGNPPVAGDTVMIALTLAVGK